MKEPVLGTNPTPDCPGPPVTISTCMVKEAAGLASIPKDILCGLRPVLCGKLYESNSCGTNARVGVVERNFKACASKISIAENSVQVCHRNYL